MPLLVMLGWLLVMAVLGGINESSCDSILEKYERQKAYDPAAKYDKVVECLGEQK